MFVLFATKLAACQQEELYLTDIPVKVSLDICFVSTVFARRKLYKCLERFREMRLVSEITLMPFPKGETKKI